MSDTLRTTVSEPHPSAGTTAHAAWKRSAARAFRQHLEGGPSLAVLERRYGARRERLETIAGEYGIVAKPRKQKGRAA